MIARSEDESLTGRSGGGDAMLDDQPAAEPRGKITGQFEVVTEVVRFQSGDRFSVTKHVFTFRDGLLVAVSEPQEVAAEIPDLPPPFAVD